MNDKRVQETASESSGGEDADSFLRAVAEAPAVAGPVTQVGRYKILKRIGAGGTGEVYKAEDATLERVVAIKLLSASAVASEDRVRRFIQEAKAASALNHPNIVTIYEIGTVPAPQDPQRSLRYIAMEYIDGATLRTAIYGKTPRRRLLELLSQVSEGLSKAHAAGIVHRDLKPDNVMVSRDGYAKVVDFGLAKLLDTVSGDGETQSVQQLAPQTREGAILGTLGYMSPEQVAGDPVDVRSDVFSFGCILFEAMTRRRPFEGRTAVDVMHQILNAEPPSILELDPGAPEELWRIARKCLAKSPADRYQSMSDLTIDLRDLASGRTSGAQPVRARRRARWALGLLGAAGGLALAGWWIADWARRAAPPAVTPASAAAATAAQPEQPQRTASPAAYRSSPPARYPCPDGATGAAPPQRPCEPGAVAWCDTRERVIACCEKGLVAVGADGICGCPPGGTSIAALAAKGCAKAPSPLPDPQAAVTGAMRALLPEVVPCFRSRLEERPNLSGRFVVGIELTPEGEVFRARIQEGGFPDAETQRCVLERIRTLKMPPPIDGVRAFSYPLEMRRESSSDR